jgi:hypothetical protein
MSPEHKNHTQNNNIGASPGTSKTSKLVGLFLSVALVVNLGCSSRMKKTMMTTSTFSGAGPAIPVNPALSLRAGLPKVVP